MAARNFSNLASEAEAAVLIASGDTSATLSNFSGFPSAPFVAAIDPDTADEEIVLVTAVVSSTVTMTRAYDGTTAKAHAAGAVFRHVAAAIDFREANDHVEATSGVHGVAGSLVGTSDTQTLSNKTLSSPTISSPTVTGTLSGASATYSGSVSAGSLTSTGDATVGNDLVVTADVTAATVTATTVTGTTVNATTLAASGNGTVGGTLGVTGALSGSSATFSGTVTGPTGDFTTGVIDEIELVEAAVDPTPTAGRSSLWARTDSGLYFQPEGETRRRAAMHWGSGSTLPTVGILAGDTYTHTGLGSATMRYNGASWRQDDVVQVANEAALPAHADLHAGFRAFSLADDCSFEYDGTNWVPEGGEQATLTLASGWSAYTGYYTPGYDLLRNKVTLRGMAMRTGANVALPIGGTVAIATIPAAIRPTATVSPLTWGLLGIPSTETYPMRLYLPSPYTTLYAAGMDTGSGTFAQNTGAVNLDGVGWYK